MNINLLEEGCLNSGEIKNTLHIVAADGSLQSSNEAFTVKSSQHDFVGIRARWCKG